MKIQIVGRERNAEFLFCTCHLLEQEKHLLQCAILKISLPRKEQGENNRFVQFRVFGVSPKQQGLFKFLNSILK